MVTILASVAGEQLTLTDAPVLASGTAQAFQVAFTFDEAWEGCGKTALFWNEDGEVYAAQVVNDRAAIPQEVLAEKGKLRFGVYGTKGAYRIVTAKVTYSVADGAYTPTAVNAAEPTPELTAQLQAAAQSAIEDMRAASDAAIAAAQAQAAACAAAVAEASALLQAALPTSDAGASRGALVRVDGTLGAPPASLKVYGRSVRAGAPSPGSPAAIVTAGEAGTLELVSCGRNLCSVFARAGNTSNGITFAYEDGAIIADGTASGGNGVSLAAPFLRVLPAGTYTVYDALAAAHARDRYIVVQAYSASGTYTTLATTNSGPASFALSEPANVTVRLGIANGASVTALGCRPVIAADGTMAGDYPYEGESASVPVAGGLAGVPVASGGNYTDAAGRQWICDEIDLARGVYVKRCGTIASYGGEALPGAWLSGMDGYASGGTPTAGAAVVYALAEPVVTDLTEAQFEALRALRGHSGTTNLYTTDAAQPELAAGLRIGIQAYHDVGVAALEEKISRLEARITALGNAVTVMESDETSMTAELNG